LSSYSQKAKKFLIMLAIGLSSFAAMNDMVIIPVAGNIFEEFSGANIAVLNYILSGPILISGIFALLCGKLMAAFRLGKRMLMLAAFAVFGVAAIFGNAINNPWYMAAMRTLIGASVGILGVVSITIISSVFVEEKARSSMIGINTAVQGLFGALLSLVAGVVGVAGWRFVYRIYLAAIPIFVLIFFLLPQDSVSDAEDGKGEIPDVAGEKMPWKTVFLMNGAFFVYNVIYCIVYYQISMFLIAKGFSDPSLIGVIAALGTVGGLVGSASFGFYYNRLKRFTICAGFALMALSYVLLQRSTTVPALMIANVLLGISFVIGLAYYTTYCTLIVPPSCIPLSISITQTTMYIGSFLSTYVTTGLQMILGTESIVGIISVLIAVSGVGAALSFAISLSTRKKERNAA
jgi:MFS family permease